MRGLDHGTARPSRAPTWAALAGAQHRLPYLLQLLSQAWKGSHLWLIRLIGFHQATIHRSSLLADAQTDAQHALPSLDVIHTPLRPPLRAPGQVLRSGRVALGQADLMMLSMHGIVAFRTGGPEDRCARCLVRHPGEGPDGVKTQPCTSCQHVWPWGTCSVWWARTYGWAELGEHGRMRRRRMVLWNYTHSCAWLPSRHGGLLLGVAARGNTRLLLLFGSSVRSVLQCVRFSRLSTPCPVPFRATLKSWSGLHRTAPHRTAVPPWTSSWARRRSSSRRGRRAPGARGRSRRRGGRGRLLLAAVAGTGAGQWTALCAAS